MKLHYGDQRRRIQYIPDSISEMKSFIEKKFREKEAPEGPPQKKKERGGKLKWEELTMVYYDSEGDRTVVSEDDDLKDAG